MKNRFFKIIISISLVLITSNLFSITSFASSPKIITEKYEWIMDNGEKVDISIDLNMDAYNFYYGNAAYQYGVYHGHKAGAYIRTYMEDGELWHPEKRCYNGVPYNYELSNRIAEQFLDLQKEYGWSKYRLACEIVNFVQQNINYKSDLAERNSIEYVKYPIETLVDKAGDCEDTSILLASILRRCGFDAAILDYPGHIAVGIAGECFTGYSCKDEENGINYYYIETTSVGWRIGEYPEILDILLEKGNQSAYERLKIYA